MAQCIYEPRNAKDYQQPPEARGTAWNRPSVRALQKDTLMLDSLFSKLGDNTISVFSHPVYGYFVTADLGNKYVLL